jgi:galactokinase
MNEILVRLNKENFIKNFGYQPEKTILSPGRINIIGEHTDYNDGFVLPAAIDKSVCFSISINNNESLCKIIALDLNDSLEIDLNGQIAPSPLSWTNYLLGILFQLKEKGFALSGFNCAFSSNIPVGSGLSSSAAIECGFAYALNKIFRLMLKPIEIVKMGQVAEHNFAGVKCGIMDQFASVFGKEKHVIKLDCRSLEYQYFPADFVNYSILLFDTNVKHALASTAYNKRRAECEEAVSIIKKFYPDILSLRDCSVSQLEKHREYFDETIFKRCHYVVKEINRVEKACEALKISDIKRLGELMFETHYALSDEYEVSCMELDLLVDTVKKEDAVIGARLMGGGFGGCTINLVEKGKEEYIKNKVSEIYINNFGKQLSIYDVCISNGSSLNDEHEF